MKTISERFEQFNEDYIQFDRVENKLSTRPDLHAFILLNNLFPRDSDMISASAHDEFFLDVEEEEIKTLTDEQILELTRCGVRYGEYGCLCMFA